jgi:hypothetical protein
MVLRWQTGGRLNGVLKKQSVRCVGFVSVLPPDSGHRQNERHVRKGS